MPEIHDSVISSEKSTSTTFNNPLRGGIYLFKLVCDYSHYGGHPLNDEFPRPTRLGNQKWKWTRFKRSSTSTPTLRAIYRIHHRPKAAGDISRTAFTTLTSQAPARDRDLAEEWKNAFTVPNRLFIKDMFRYMFGINRPEFGVDDKWYPVRLVGHGSFGAAGLFKHLHEQGRVNDVSQSPSRIRGY